MSYEKIADECFENLLRVDDIVFLASLAGQDSVPRSAEQIFEDMEPKDFKALFGKCPNHIKEFLKEEEYSEIVSWLADNKFFGFILKVCTPIMQGDDEKTSHFTWGRCHVTLVYGESIEEAMEAGFKWAKSING